MFESNLLGTHPKFYRTAKQHTKVVTELELNLTLVEEDALWNKIVDTYDGKDYDFPGFFYLSWRVLLYKLFKCSLPKKNVLAKTGMHLCVAVLDAVDEYLPTELQSALADIDVEMTPINQLRDILKAHLKK